MDILKKKQRRNLTYVLNMSDNLITAALEKASNGNVPLLCIFLKLLFPATNENGIKIKSKEPKEMLEETQKLLAKGLITPAQLNPIVRLIESKAQLNELEELEQRLKELESKGGKKR